MDTSKKVSPTWVADHSLNEWVKKDSRSVAAMLAGSGDGRERQYAQFLRMSRRVQPNISEEERMEAYSNFCQDRACGNFPSAFTVFFNGAKNGSKFKFLAKHPRLALCLDFAVHCIPNAVLAVFSKQWMKNNY
ncbi:hypothetical protein [Noviherbaspirillum galbum]|uniref:Uncharacterized protein n=1 Tax=Noviherbaspirillum galbum TaxID=2709383 RepID=A0A6B3SVP9_9BURK|nr:hypothetical protein [Noviherbaspirillum galbum]NEX64903.1 hypothetical protein [Noviherbaspirillum galbum]